MPGPNTQLVLAGYTFQDLEVPPNIRFGTELIKKVHKLPGGVRRIDAITGDDDDVEWEGLFLGPDASANARAMQSFCKGGQAVDLDWWDLSFSVLISKFEITFERFYQCGYKITCTVVQDNSLPPLPGAQQSVDDFIDGDASGCYAGAEALGMIVPGLLPGPVSSALGIIAASMAIAFTPGPFGVSLVGLAVGLTAMRGALNSTSSFSGISSAQLAIVDAAIILAAEETQAAIAEIEAKIANAPGCAGMVSGVDDPAVFLEIMAEAGQEAQLIAMADYMTRIEFNVGAGAV